MAKPNVDFSNEENWLPPKVAPSALVIIACHIMCFSFPFDVNSWHHNGYLSWKETLLAQFTRMFAHHANYFRCPLADPAATVGGIMATLKTSPFTFLWFLF